MLAIPFIPAIVWLLLGASTKCKVPDAHFVCVQGKPGVHRLLRDAAMVVLVRLARPCGRVMHECAVDVAECDRHLAMYKLRICQKSSPLAGMYSESTRQIFCVTPVEVTGLKGICMLYLVAISRSAVPRQHPRFSSSTSRSG